MYIFKKDDFLYNWISCLVKDRIYFGPYPNLEMINHLKKEKFTYIIDLTNGCEEESYLTNNKESKENELSYIHFPIQDHNIPYCATSYCNFIVRLKTIYQSGNKLYIHCRGGHGRSSMVATSLYYILYDIDLKTAIESVSQFHNDRVNLREHWKSKKMPINYNQFQFLKKIHKNIYINMKNYNKYYHWLYWNGSFESDNMKYDDFYDFFRNSKLTNDEKMESISHFYINRFKENKEFECKMQLTFLKKFILTDSEDPLYAEVYQNSLKNARETLIYNL